MSLEVMLRTVGLILSVSACSSEVKPETTPTDALVAQLQNPAGDVMVIGHRGCWETAPENSIAAIEACIDLGVDMVEVDVQRSADGELVLVHDGTVDRTTNGSGTVETLTLNEIRMLQLRSGAGGLSAGLTRHTIPTLREALEAARGQILVNIDAKADVYADVSRLLVSMNIADQVLMKMPAAPDDPRLRAEPLMAQAHFMPVLFERGGHGPVSRLQPGYDDLNPVAYEIVFENRAYYEEGLDALRRSGRRIWVNTLLPQHAAGHTDAAALEAPDAHWGRLADEGVSMIQTDEPRALIAYLCQTERRRRCLRQPGP